RSADLAADMVGHARTAQFEASSAGHHRQELGLYAYAAGAKQAPKVANQSLFADKCIVGATPSLVKKSQSHRLNIDLSTDGGVEQTGMKWRNVKTGGRRSFWK